MAESSCSLTFLWLGAAGLGKGRLATWRPPVLAHLLCEQRLLFLCQSWWGSQVAFFFLQVFPGEPSCSVPSVGGLVLVAF